MDLPLVPLWQWEVTTRTRESQNKPVKGGAITSKFFLFGTQGTKVLGCFWNSMCILNEGLLSAMIREDMAEKTTACSRSMETALSAKPGRPLLNRSSRAQAEGLWQYRRIWQLVFTLFAQVPVPHWGCQSLLYCRSFVHLTFIHFIFSIVSWLSIMWWLLSVLGK